LPPKAISSASQNREGWHGRLDISQVDFEALRKKFETGKKRTEIQKLKSALERKLKVLVELNRSRMDYLERFKRLIEEYNSGAHNVEAIFDELIKLARELQEEERRHLKEGISEEELAIFDLLMKPAPEMTEKDKKQVKKVARDLLELLKREKLVLDWRKKEMTRASVRQTIEILLDYLPEAFDKDLYEQKSDGVYRHVYDAYYGQGASVFAAVH
jgi:type I restriction enzyme, R subunit